MSLLLDPIVGGVLEDAPGRLQVKSLAETSVVESPAVFSFHFTQKGLRRQTGDGGVELFSMHDGVKTLNAFSSSQNAKNATFPCSLESGEIGKIFGASKGIGFCYSHLVCNC